MSDDLILTSRRVIADDGVAPATVVIRDGVIASLESPPSANPNAGLDLGDAVIMAGLVDSHVHVDEPGHTEWEGFATATRAAAAGGVTTVVDMPLNSLPVTTTVAALAEKRAAAARSAHVDYGFWGGVVPGNAAELTGLWEEGVLGFKCFLVPSGLPEFPPVSEADLEEAMPILARLGAVLLVHAELPGPIDVAAAACSPSTRLYDEYLASRPPAAERAAIDLLIDLCARTGCAVHVVHLSDAGSLEKLAAARRARLPVTVETCPHYLSFAAEEIPEGATVYKCAPPIRGKENRELLWQGLRAGIIDLIASDHSPCLPAMKRTETGDFIAAWGGISSLGLTLPVVWTEMRRRGFDLTDLAKWVCRGPARLAGLGDRKGRIAVGYDGDLVVWHPEREFTVDRSSLLYRHPIGPYVGRRLRGVVERTFLRGEVVFDGAGTRPETRGRWLRREGRNAS